MKTINILGGITLALVILTLLYLLGQQAASRRYERSQQKRDFDAMIRREQGALTEKLLRESRENFTREYNKNRQAP